MGRSGTRSGPPCFEAIGPQTEKPSTPAVQAVLYQELERRLLSLEVHDVISQPLASLFYRLQMCEHRLARERSPLSQEMAEIRQRAQDLLDDVTRLIFTLRPPVLDAGAFTALRRYVVEFRRETSLQVQLWTAPQEGRIGELCELFLYRIVQEALTNVRKHARASHVEVSIRLEEGQVCGRVADDGKGFDLRAVLDQAVPTGHFGLWGMRERARLLGGNLDVASGLGLGTTVLFTLPVGGEIGDAR